MLIRQDLVDFPLVHGRKLANDMVCIKPVVNGGIVIQCLSSGPVFFSINTLFNYLTVEGALLAMFCRDLDLVKQYGST